MCIHRQSSDNSCVLPSLAMSLLTTLSESLLVMYLSVLLLWQSVIQGTLFLVYHLHHQSVSTKMMSKNVQIGEANN